MFDFFDNEKNPFMYMINMDNPESEAEPEKESADVGLTQMMQQFYMMQMQMMNQTFTTHMQMMQLMCMMPMQFTRGIFNTMGMSTSSESDPAELSAPGSDEQRSGFKLGNMEIPPELLTRLMQMDMRPENLEKLQRFLDFVFEVMPQSKEESAVKQEER